MTNDAMTNDLMTIYSINHSINQPLNQSTTHLINHSPNQPFLIILISK